MQEGGDSLDAYLQQRIEGTERRRPESDVYQAGLYICELYGDRRVRCRVGSLGCQLWVSLEDSPVKRNSIKLYQMIRLSDILSELFERTLLKNSFRPISV